jgi:hypothetical protein
VRQPPEQKGPSSGEGGEELVAIATFENDVEASVAKGALEAEGIPASVPEKSLGAFMVYGSLRAELKVRACDRDRAIRTLRLAGHR